VKRKGDWAYAGQRDIEAEHSEFQESVVNSEPSVLFVAEWLCSRNNLVNVLPHTIAPTRDKWAEHSDSGDMLIATPKGLSLAGEVKAIRHEFDHHRYPYPNRVFIDSVEKYDRKNPEPDVYFILSADWAAVASIQCKTKPTWWSERIPDPISRVLKDTYCCTAEQIELHDTRHVRESTKLSRNDYYR
jgi:hypothetical protein